MKQNIYINARFLSQSITGVQRYAIELVKALDELIERGEIDSERFSFVLVSPQDIKHELCLKHIPLKKVGKKGGHLWEQLELPFYTEDGLLVNLCNTAPLFKHKQTVTMHDANVFVNPQFYSFAFKTWYHLMFHLVGKNAQAVFTVSEFSKKELGRLCGIEEQKIHAIYLGKEHMLNVEPEPEVLDKFDLRNKRFVLAVSSMSPNKNFHSIVQAIELLKDEGYEVVIAGGTNPKIFKTEAELPPFVKYIGYVSDGELRSLYEQAACFVFPSFYEGFGLPPLEAMACGCPVIVSDAASLPEVGGDATLYCDPHSPEDIAAKIRRLVTDERLQQRLREQGIERADQFTWAETARQTMAVIEEVLAR